MNSKTKLSKHIILKVSAELIRTKSFSQVSMRSIAQKLDVKAASLYNHISSKNEILETLIFECVDIFMDTIEQTKQKQVSTEEKLIEIIQTHISLALNAPHQFAILNKDWIFLNEVQKQIFVQKRIQYENDLRLIIEEGIEKNEIKNSNPDLIIYLILSSLRTLHLWYERKDVKSTDFKTEIPKLILSGVLR